MSISARLYSKMPLDSFPTETEFIAVPEEQHAAALRHHWFQFCNMPNVLPRLAVSLLRHVARRICEIA